MLKKDTLIRELLKETEGYLLIFSGQIHHTFHGLKDTIDLLNSLLKLSEKKELQGLLPVELLRKDLEDARYCTALPEAAKDAYFAWLVVKLKEELREIRKKLVGMAEQ